MKDDHTSITTFKTGKHEKNQDKRAQPYCKTNPTPSSIYIKIVFKALDLLNY